MNNEELLKKIKHARRTVTFDKSRQISDDDWQTLLKVAQNAPTSNGLEPWNILQIDNPELRKKISKSAPGMVKQLEGADKFIIFTMTTDKAHNRHIMRDIHGYSVSDYLTFSGSFKLLHTALLDISYEAWLERQAAIPLGQILLAAGLLDIDCCPMEGFFYKKVTKILSKAGVLNPAKEKLAVAVAFGYRLNEAKHEKSRRPLDEIMKII